MTQRVPHTYPDFVILCLVLQVLIKLFLRVELNAVYFKFFANLEEQGSTALMIPRALGHRKIPRKDTAQSERKKEEGTQVQAPGVSDRQRSCVQRPQAMLMTLSFMLYPPPRLSVSPLSRPE